MNRVALKGAGIVLVALATAVAASLVPAPEEEEEPVAAVRQVEPAAAPVTKGCKGAWPYVDPGCLAAGDSDEALPEIRVIRPGHEPIGTVDSAAVSGT